MQNKNRSRYRKQTCDYQRGEEQMRDIGLTDTKFHTQTR